MTKSQLLKKMAAISAVAQDLPEDVDIMRVQIDDHREHITFYSGMDTVCARNSSEVLMELNSDFPSTIWKSTQVGAVKLQEINYI